MARSRAASEYVCQTCAATVPQVGRAVPHLRGLELARRDARRSRERRTAARPRGALCRRAPSRGRWARSRPRVATPSPPASPRSTACSVAVWCPARCCCSAASPASASRRWCCRWPAPSRATAAGDLVTSQRALRQRRGVGLAAAPPRCAPGPDRRSGRWRAERAGRHRRGRHRHRCLGRAAGAAGGRLHPDGRGRRPRWSAGLGRPGARVGHPAGCLRA